jgi:hypothetical protein
MSDRRTVCEDANRILLSQLWPIMARACSGRAQTLDPWHTALTHVRDILHHAVEHRSERGFDEFELMHIPLVDALGYMNDALGSNPLPSRPVRLAFDCLRDLKGVLEAPRMLQLEGGAA